MEAAAALGGSVAFRQEVELGFVGEQPADEVIIIHYPSRQAYLDMFHSPAYQEALAALGDGATREFRYVEAV